MRTKQLDAERLYELKMDVLNKKIATLVKEVGILSRSAKKNGGGGPRDKESMKDSGGSGTDSPVTN